MRERGGAFPFPPSGDESAPGSLAGMMLLSHPIMRDKHFKKTAVLLAAHSPQDGAMGVIVNRPLDKTLGEMMPGFSESPLALVPLYEGGPVDADRVIFAGWKRDRAQRRLQLHFGIEKDFAEQLLRDEPDAGLRGFLGYAGWRKAQLEGELEAGAWCVSKIDADLLDSEDGPGFWRAMIAKTSPDLRLLSESPDEPENN